ncbi:hypothetical protein BDV95DRAFT_587148, partial [Massariosphaeria phaeospora]
MSANKLRLGTRPSRLFSTSTAVPRVRRVIGGTMETPQEARTTSIAKNPRFDITLITWNDKPWDLGKVSVGFRSKLREIKHYEAALRHAEQQHAAASHDYEARLWEFHSKYYGAQLAMHRRLLPFWRHYEDTSLLEYMMHSFRRWKPKLFLRSLQFFQVWPAKSNELNRSMALLLSHIENDNFKGEAVQRYSPLPAEYLAARAETTSQYNRLNGDIRRQFEDLRNTSTPGLKSSPRAFADDSRAMRLQEARRAALAARYQQLAQLNDAYPGMWPTEALHMGIMKSQAQLRTRLQSLEFLTRPASSRADNNGAYPQYSRRHKTDPKARARLNALVHAMAVVRQDLQMFSSDLFVFRRHVALTSSYLERKEDVALGKALYNKIAGDRLDRSGEGMRVLTGPRRRARTPPKKTRID